MPKTTLTAAFCRDAVCPPGKKRVDHWDTHIPGWVMEIRETQKRSFYLRYADRSGRQRQILIAGPEVPFDQIRKAAIRMR